MVAVFETPTDYEKHRILCRFSVILDTVNNRFRYQYHVFTLITKAQNHLKEKKDHPF